MSENRGFPCGIRFLNFQNYLTSKPSFFLTLRTSQTLEKLALIQGYLYIREDFSGGRFTATKNLSIDKFSQSRGEKPAKLKLSHMFGSLMAATALTLSAPAFAKDNTAQTSQAAVQTVSIQNPYEAACHGLTDQEFKDACYDAAKGTVVILRNPSEVSDIVARGFEKAINRRYNSGIPIEFRDTTGSTRLFMFDRNMAIEERMFVSGSLLLAIGKNYPVGAARLPNPASAPS